MKKWLIALLLGCGCMAVAAGCGADDTQKQMQDQINQLQNQLNSYTGGTSMPQVGDLPSGNPDVVTSQVVPPPNASSSVQTPSNNQTASQAAAVQGQQTANNGQISLEQAKQIALKHAGVSNATFLKTQTDMDHGVMKYELEFYAGNTEYDYDINASTGAVMSYSTDHHNVAGAAGNPNTAAATGDIGAAKAQQIALNHAGVSASNAWGMKTEMDFDNGIRVYEVEFYNNNMEYQYEINAANGNIVKYERDYD